ncbi:unnamed protein product [Ascophyllum nodosum]
MNVTKLENVVPLPLELNEYAEATLDIFGQEARMSPIKLLKHLQNVCIVYACLAVKRNAGIVNIEAKHAAAAKAFKDIAVLGFFKWLQKNGIEFKMPWLTLDVMGRPTMSGAPVLFTHGKKLWKRFDKGKREMKKSYNKVWDICIVVFVYHYVQGQPGGNLSSGNQSEDALDYLLNGLHATTAGNADNPVEEEDLDDDADNDTDGGEGAGKQDDTEASSTEQVEDGAGERQQGKKGAIGTQESKAGGSPGGGRDDDSSENHENAEGGFPDRPNNWMHSFLLTYCLIGRRSSSENPDLKTARKTSDPKGRKGKRKAKQGSPNTSEDSGSEASGAVTEVDLSSSAIRMSTDR